MTAKFMYVQSNLTEWLTWGRRKQLYFPCVFPRKHPFHTDLEESMVISKVIMIKFVNIKNKIETNLSIFPKIKYFKFNKPVVHYGQSILLYTLKGKWGLLKWLGGKESACNVGDLSLIPGLGKEMATHSSVLAWRIHRQRSLVGSSRRGHKELDMTERAHRNKRSNAPWRRVSLMTWVSLSHTCGW